ncbi:uncharacterized protein EV422DRAFT_565158 [Fimicolochytrium jonesii]|uniref:uncharacterized protein n=1 Tax=Fimicolochytrium jonesii TaxID=1396493 RepID=UPI0022FEA216|nr:uncharacterized protein EV422DRAFT_565158 [Fimicolochytrium jonesii]KAI8824469.1 hypothetical protein EV422DRAFT_565158 [Fimicolochytrium jonesii]
MAAEGSQHIPKKRRLSNAAEDVHFTKKNAPANSGIAGRSKVERLLEWAKSHGASFPKLNFQDGPQTDDPLCASRGVYASDTITTKEVITSIPYSLVLSETVARSSPFGAKLHSYLQQHASDITHNGKDPYAPGLILVSAFLVYEMYENAGSFWKPYLEALPEEYSLPLSWPESEVAQLLKGTNLYHIVEERRKLLQKGLEMVREACGDMFIRNSLIWPNLLWAYSAVSSRAFPRSRPATAEDREHAAEEAAEISSGASELCLYPVLDMLNHRRGHRIEWRIEDGQSVSFIALEDVAAAGEVFNNYGAKGNENLLGNYGFVLDPNPEDYVKVALNIRDESDPCAQRKRELLAAVQPNRLVHLLFAGDDETALPPDLVAVTRLLVMNEHGIELDLHGGAALRSAVNPRNEVATYSTLWQLLGGKLREISKPLQTGGVDAERVRMVTVYRQGQARILRHNMTLATQALCSFLQLKAGPTSPISSILLTLDSSHLPHCFRSLMSTLTAQDEDELFDEDTLLCLAVAHEMQVGDKSAWRGVPATTRHSEELISAQAAELYAHFQSNLSSVLHDTGPCACGAEFTNELFAVAANLLETHGVDIPPGMCEDVQGYGVLMIE